MSFLRSSFVKLPKYKKFDYKPMYYDADAEERKKKRELRLERGSFYKNKSTIAGAFTEKEFAFRARRNSNAQFARTLMLTVMMGVIFAFFMGKLNIVIAIGLIAICLILFVKNVNRMG